MMYAVGAGAIAILALIAKIVRWWNLPKVAEARTARVEVRQKERTKRREARLSKKEERARIRRERREARRRR